MATGTGSGKTETFLIPILNHLFRQKEQGQLGPGVRTLLLYPMNALANDQLKRLRRLLKNYPDITFGSYTGETLESESRAIEQFRRQNPKEPLLQNELLSRERMKKTPPHILLTNYAMLEFLLLRPDDNVFFDGEYALNWKFIVVDEVHTYSGAKGIEFAMLLRRLKNRVVNSRHGVLQCIGTSATLVGNDEKDFKQVVKFGQMLFDEKFEWESKDDSLQDVVMGHRKPLAIQENSWGQPNSRLYIEWLRVLDEGVDDSINRLVEIAKRLGVPNNVLDDAIKYCGDDWRSFIYRVLCGDSRVIKLQHMLEKEPHFLDKSAQVLFPEHDECQKHLVALVYLCNAARLGPGYQPLIPARYHLFIRALEGGYVSLVPKKQLYLERREWAEYKDGEKYPVFEVATCSRCSSLYLVGERQPKGSKIYLAQPGELFFENKSSLEYFLVLDDRGIVPDNQDELIMAGLEAEESTNEREYLLCGKCGAIKPANEVNELCDCSQEHIFRILLVRTSDGNVHKCPACGSVSPKGSIVRRFMLGAEAATSVLATALYQEIPEQKIVIENINDEELDEWAPRESVTHPKTTRRLLIFSDSRQDAAFFSTYLQNTYNQILQRRLIIMTLQKHKERVQRNGWGLDDLVEQLKATIREYGLISDYSSNEQLEKEAWRWVLLEFMGYDRSTGLEGLGLLGFIPEIPWTWQSVPAFERYWGFDKEELARVIMVLLDTIRRNGAVCFPDALPPSDDFFAPRNREFYFKNGEAVSGSIYSWSPVGKSGNNSRLDYMIRLAERRGLELERKFILESLNAIWNRLLISDKAPWKDHFSVKSINRRGSCYQLNLEPWRLVPSIIDDSIKWYRCTRCRRLTLHNVWNVCPTYRCDGKLIECDPDKELADDHYRNLYLDILPMGMRTSEHTAQLTTQKAGQVQKAFDNGDINVLSCSTTFELGVDVGELEAVFMRNVPPSISNYVQRAGRAGRRASSTAFVLTFAQRRSHDFSHFNEPLKIINGRIKPPHVDIKNEKIVRRHMYAVALAMFWKQHRAYYGRVKDFFRWPGESATRRLREWLDTKPIQLEKSLKNIVPSDMWDEVELYDWKWIDGLFHADFGVLKRAEDQLISDLQELTEMENRFSANKRHAKANDIRRAINTLEGRNILTFLSQRNVIPKYGFPVDVVELQIYHHGKDANGLELDRDLKVALSEYAPESQVVAGGWLWTSKYIKKLPDRDPIKYNYAICDVCGVYMSAIADTGNHMDYCAVCDARIGRRRGTFITPEFGFMSDKQQKPSMSRPERTYTTRKYFASEGNIEYRDQRILRRFNISLSSGDGKLAVVNNAHGAGFKICRLCGYAEINTGKNPSKHNTVWGRECNGFFENYALGYEFSTDILRIEFQNYRDGRDGFWNSLLYGILEGACSALEIERSDIDGTLYSYAGDPASPALILFDEVPGGAGHVKRIAQEENFMAVLEEAYRIVKTCECGGKQGDTSCYGCLRNYTNQYCHSKLKRGYVIEFLEDLLEKL